MAQNPNIDDDTRARARKFVADKETPAKQRIVSKKELADSGLSLRDFLNKERGLTRRKDPEDGGKAKVERQSPGMTPAEYVSSGKAMVDKQDEEAKMDKLNSAYRSRSSSKLSDVVRPGTNTNYENKEVSDMGMKRGGKVKKMASGGMTSSASKRADGIAQRGKTRA
jgi:hypothetical protein